MSKEDPIKQALIHAGRMCTHMDGWISSMSRGDAKEAGEHLRGMLEERKRYDRLIVAAAILSRSER